MPFFIGLLFLPQERATISGDIPPASGSHARSHGRDIRPTRNWGAFFSPRPGVPAWQPAYGGADRESAGAAHYPSGDSHTQAFGAPCLCGAEPPPALLDAGGVSTPCLTTDRTPGPVRRRLRTAGRHVNAPVSIGLIGLGKQGERLATTFAELHSVKLITLCDVRPATRAGARRRFPHTRWTTKPEDVLEDGSLDAVVVATPAHTHPDLVLGALEAGKHVFVEPPLAFTGTQANALVESATQRKRCLMVGHAMLFQPAVRKLKELIDLGRLGDIHYLDANRATLGGMRYDRSVLWSLGPQEVAAMVYLLDADPIAVSADGAAHVRRDGEDVLYCQLRFPDGVHAHLHLSRLNPRTARQLTVVGSRRVAFFDELEAERKLTVYGTVAQPPRREASGEMRIRHGDTVSPRVAAGDSLRLECEHFISSIRAAGSLVTGPSRAASEVWILEALQRSLERGGLPEPVGNTPARVDNVRPLRPRIASS